jgi:hypothetical protein
VITLSSDNDLNKPRAITIKNGNFLESVEALSHNAKM